jgi:hypothetical protein
MANTPSTRCFVFLICLIAIKVITKKKLSDYNYTPFDYITAHTNIEFHEEKEEKEEDDDQGDDKNKNERNIKEVSTNVKR